MNIEERKSQIIEYLRDELHFAETWGALAYFTMGAVVATIVCSFAAWQGWLK